LRLVGDVVFTTPLIPALRRPYPSPRPTLPLQPAAAPHVPTNPPLSRFKDLDFAGVNAGFTIAGIFAVGELGFGHKGEGGPFSAAQSMAVNRSGGLKSKGHPVGATGVAQIAIARCRFAGRRREIGRAHV